MNRIIVTGRITADPELKKTQSGTSVCSFNLAVDDGYGDKKKTFFFRICTANKTAENVCKFCRKGSEVGFEGRLTNREYEKNGQKVSVTEIWADSVTFFSKAKEEEKPKQEQTLMDGFESVSDDDLPF